VRSVGLAALTVLELAPAEQIGIAAQAGYDCVGLRLIPVGAQVLPRFDEREVERRLDDSGVKVLDVEVFRLTPEVRVSDFEPTMATSARLHASQLLVHGDDADQARLTESFARLCDLAARYGLAVNLEPMPWVEVSNVAKARRVLDSARRKNSALLVDAIHFFRTDNRFEELQGVRLNYMQLCDAPAQRPADMQEIVRQARADRLFPGEGGLDLKGLLRALPRDLPISLEIPYAKPKSPLDRARQALSSTRKLLEELQ
jgi:sugar phosphate isomerase/epimerase